ncbi:ATP-binding protein [Flavobacterium sp.]|uniref:GAF domain-containing sensor histidine kinase n=1 Tax=Flavobacterium sp. TaxID=239 RepID=UPI0025C36BE0|nr:ATP-binding protein [Flavobacterium sp.]
MVHSEENFCKDINDIGKISIIPSLLDVICRTTKMGFSAVARVTEDRWIACQVKDDISFGLKPGGELEIQTTICNEIRQDQSPVIIDHVSKDPNFKDHHTPAMYGFESYISVPIIRKDGAFFGTLCAIDPNPHMVSSPEITQMFLLFADLISFHLEAVSDLEISELMLEEERHFSDELEARIQQRTHELEQKNEALASMNKELQAFAYISSHDLQEPLRKIQTFGSFILEKEFDNLSDNGKKYFQRMQDSAARMQSLINDLLAYSRTTYEDWTFEVTDLGRIVDDISEDLSDEIERKKVILEADMCTAKVITFQFRLLLHNLVANSVKFSKPDRAPHIKIKSRIAPASEIDHVELRENTEYCHITVSDNGIGFDEQYSEKIFGLFQRLHPRTEYEGTGIGLAIVRKIVENHNGVVTARSKPDMGSVFDIYIPAS